MLKSERLEELLKNTADMALKRRARMIIHELNLRDGDKILEIGCGNGYYMHLLSNLGLKLKLVGIDNHKGALRDARRFVSDKKVKFLFADANNPLPFKGNSFDKVIMSEVLEHLANDIKTLREVNRVLKKDGTFIVTVPNYNFPILWDPINWFLQRLFDRHIKSGFWAGIWNQHNRLYKTQDIKKVIKLSRFKILKTKCITFWSVPFSHYILNFAAIVLDRRNYSGNFADTVNKFKVDTRKPFYITFAYWVFNTLDKLNNLYTPKNIGVSVFVKATK